MAQVKMVEIGERLWRIMGIAMPKLPAGIQTALKLRVGAADVSWALALVLAGWGLLKKGDEPTRAALQETGALPLVNQLDGVAAVLPASFTKFLNAADQADDESGYAGASVYLTDAFNDLIDLQRNAIITWLNGVMFRDAARALVGRYPQPDSGLAPAWGSELTAPVAPSPPPARQSRAERFDRADRPRPRPRPAVATKAMPDEPAPPDPNLSAEDIARAHLHTAGWNVDEANRLLSGPKGTTGSLLQIRRILKAYTGLPKTERMLFQKLVDEAEQAFTKEELQAVGIDDLGDIRSADALAVTKGLELFRAYKRLAVRDRQRVLKYVIQNETRFTAEEMNKVDISGISPKELE